MKRALLAIALAACAPQATSVPPSPPPVTVEDLGAELRRLRAIPGHFGGGAWNDDVDGFQGRKHVVMEALERQLARATRAHVVEVMGPPDAVARPGEPWWQGETQAATVRLVYYWRGRHDVLYFDMRGDAVVGSGWWMAGE